MRKTAEFNEHEIIREKDSWYLWIRRALTVEERENALYVESQANYLQPVEPGGVRNEEVLRLHNTHIFH